jgi:hypothetical protein
VKFKIPFKKILPFFAIAVFLLVAVYGGYLFLQNLSLKKELEKNVNTIQQISTELDTLKTQDPYKTNAELKKEIDDIQKTFSQAVTTYESLLDLENPPKNIKGLDELFANVLVLLGKRDYTEASKKLSELTTKIKDEEVKITTTATIPQNIPASNAAPGSGYSRQKVTTDAGDFQVDIIAADLASTKVIVDTASDSTCANECPVLPLATYVSRSGAYAGVNGSYFCPATYPTCSGKTNSFDLLLMNKNKTWFNSDNNVYSNNPGAVFEGSRVNFVAAVSQVGRDTGIDGMISNYPLLVINSNIAFGGDDDPKKGSKGSRSFVASKGNTVYIGVVHSATVAESARVMKALGMEGALNLDNGGSTALWSGGYKVGPGRDLPNVILFVKK